MELPGLPTGWRWRRLAQLVAADGDICYGILRPGRHESTGVPMIRVKDIRDSEVDARGLFRVATAVESRQVRSRLRGGEILLTLVGTVGNVAVVPASMNGFNVARAVAVVPVDDDGRYISFCLRAPLAQRHMRMWATTTVQKTLNLRDVRRLPVPWPERRERREIVRLLGALDDKIALNRRMNRTLEELARAAFRARLVDFEGHGDLVPSRVGLVPRG